MDCFIDEANSFSPKDAFWRSTQRFCNSPQQTSRPYQVLGEGETTKVTSSNPTEFAWLRSGSKENALSHPVEISSLKPSQQRALNPGPSPKKKGTGQSSLSFPNQNQPDTQLLNSDFALQKASHTDTLSKKRSRERAKTPGPNKKGKEKMLRLVSGKPWTVSPSARMKSPDRLNLDNSSKSEIDPDLAREAVVARLYELVANDKHESLRIDLNTFLKNVQHTYFHQRTTDRFVNMSLFEKRLSFIMNASLLQNQIYAHLYHKVEVEESDALIKFQYETFDFLTNFWKSTVTLKEREYDHTKGNIFNQYLETAKTFFESDNTNELSAALASWKGTEAFVNCHWKEQLTNFDKYSIQKKVLSLANKKGLPIDNYSRYTLQSQAYLDPTKTIEKDGLTVTKGDPSNISASLRRLTVQVYSIDLGEAALNECNIDLEEFLGMLSDMRQGWLATLKTTPNERILNRIAYVMKASLIKIQIYVSLIMGEHLRPDDMNNVGRKAFDLLKNFCKLALFGEEDPISKYIKIKTSTQDYRALLQVRKKLITDGRTAEKAESATWDTTKFFIRWFWDENLENYRRIQINDEIIIRGTQFGLPDPTTLANKKREPSSQVNIYLFPFLLTL
ncbi:hypothetical protein O181_039954 [Austropuccinia psidii MF-1]|uniref:Uncharacterized protein n=1 Tax=Austropuccinia psidii MF-1 TaxID=1389203 RepID=A0A9Q3DBA9_9BASI|nr:hypothetical protein [Austropuccinia psidii MF-1]